MQIGQHASHLSAQYDERRSLYAALMAEALYALEAAVANQSIKTHSITGRVKEEASFLEKVVRKAYTDPFEEIPDLVGVRVVCLFMSDLPLLRQIVFDQFDVLEEDDKIEGGPAESFGYMSHHFLCRLKRGHAGPRYDSIMELRLEVQCRTLLMDAWANVSHYLAYKGEASIPDSLRRDFHALSGLFYVADQHFQLFVGSAQATETKVAQQVERARDSEELPIDRASMAALLRQIYPDRRQAEPEVVSEFVEEVSKIDKYRSVGQLRRALGAASGQLAQYESQFPMGLTSEASSARYGDVGAARISLSIFDEDYAQLRHTDGARFVSYRTSLAAPDGDAST